MSRYGSMSVSGIELLAKTGNKYIFRSTNTPCNELSKSFWLTPGTTVCVGQHRCPMIGYVVDKFCRLAIRELMGSEPCWSCWTCCRWHICCPTPNTLRILWLAVSDTNWGWKTLRLSCTCSAILPHTKHTGHIMRCLHTLTACLRYIVKSSVSVT